MKVDISALIFSHTLFTLEILTSFENKLYAIKLAIGLRSFTITFLFLRYASQQKTPYPENGSIIVSPGFVYFSTKGLMPVAGFLPQYLCIKYRGAFFSLFIFSIV